MLRRLRRMVPDIDSGLSIRRQTEGRVIHARSNTRPAAPELIYQIQNSHYKKYLDKANIT